MKNYIISSLLISVTLLAILGGGWWSMGGFIMLVILVFIFSKWPKMWRDFWLTNARILAYFNCL